MRKPIVVFFLFSFCVLILFCCQQSADFQPSLAQAEQKDQADQQESQPPAPEKVETIERKIIKEGNISFETANLNDTKTLITKVVQELNGYISSENAHDYSERLEHQLVIRIPADKFDLLLEKIASSIQKLDSKNINVLDVTAEYIDIEARIKTQKELQARYKELLSKATKVDEILNIEKEIGQLQTEIESVEGRMKYLKDRISFSTLTVNYYEKKTTAFGFSSRFVNAIKGGWDTFLMFIVGLAHLWVFILIGGLVLYFVIRNKRKAKNA